MVEVGKAHEECHKILESLEGYKYLWDWQWHHKSCTSQPLECSKLTTLEKEFTFKDYKEHLCESREYMDDTVVNLNKRIRAEYGKHPSKVLH